MIEGKGKRNCFNSKSCLIIIKTLRFVILRFIPIYVNKRIFNALKCINCFNVKMCFKDLWIGNVNGLNEEHLKIR